MNIALLGLGAMGSRMANRLIAAGHAVTVWNRSPAATEPYAGRATIAATPRAAADGAEIVLSMVRDDPAARAVWLDADSGALASMAAGSVAIECSTVTPGWATELHAAAVARGLACLDAPVAGTLPQAEAGVLIFMAGGNADVLARVEPVLLAMGSAAHLVGPAGAGARIKLAVNALLAIQLSAAAELLGALGAQGMDIAAAGALIAAMPVASPALKNYLPGLLGADVPRFFPVDMIAKDLSYALATAPTPVPLTQATRDVLQRAIEAGHGDANITAVTRLYR
jgi:3-hydroxyisobutyrate dehydrogenase